MPSYNSFGLDRTSNTGFSIPVQTYIPTNTLSEGVSPAGRFIVAPYLPTLRFNEEKHVDVVIASGKVLAMDSKGQIVPAGLRYEAAEYATALATSVAAADAQALVRYSTSDVAKGVRNFKGVIVTANEPVVKSFFTGTTLDNPISYFVGVGQYDIFRHAGGDNLTPTALRDINMNVQPVIAFLSDYHMQYPVVKDVATIRTAPLAGIAAVVAAKTAITFGTFITYDRESNFVPCSDLHGYGTADQEAIVGQVTGLRVYKDPATDAVTGNHNWLDRVVTPNAATASVLNRVPGSDNQGIGTFLEFSNGYAVAEFGIQTR
jgi:hypothetical protein